MYIKYPPTTNRVCLVPLVLGAKVFSLEKEEEKNILYAKLVVVYHLLEMLDSSEPTRLETERWQWNFYIYETRANQEVRVIHKSSSSASSSYERERERWSLRRRQVICTQEPPTIILMTIEIFSGRHLREGNETTTYHLFFSDELFLPS